VDKSRIDRRLPFRIMRVAVRWRRSCYRYLRIASAVAAVFLFSIAASAADTHKQNDPDQIGRRKVECTPNLYSTEKEIALGKGLAQQVERQAKVVDESQVAE
jgi:hypothetical protein